MPKMVADPGVEQTGLGAYETPVLTVTLIRITIQVRAAVTLTRNKTMYRI